MKYNQSVWPDVVWEEPAAIKSLYLIAVLMQNVILPKNKILPPSRLTKILPFDR